MFRKIISLFIVSSLFFQQTGFAQLAIPVQPVGNPFLAGAMEKYRPLHLRYLSLESDNSLNLLFDKGNLRQQSEIEQQSPELLRYFLIGLSLPNEAFWVNLRPDAPDNVIDRDLAKTDMGKVMLEADLQLKKDTALYTSPNTKQGRLYWDRLYKKAEELFGSENVSIPTLSRPWIVPGEIIISETATGAYVYKAQLKVMLEQDYLKDSSAFDFKDARFNELNAYASGLMRELVIPAVTKEINSSKKYAALRQVYYSLIFSQWFKQKKSGTASPYSIRIDSRDLQGLTSSSPWSKDTYFNAYRDSFNKGEYNIQENVTSASGMDIRNYVSGGMKFVIPPAKLDGGSLSNNALTALAKLPEVLPAQFTNRAGMTVNLIRVKDIVGNKAKFSDSGALTSHAATTDDPAHNKVVKKDGGEITSESDKLSFEQRKVLSEFLATNISLIFNQGVFGRPAILVTDPIKCLRAQPIADLLLMTYQLGGEDAKRIVALFPEDIQEKLKAEAERVGEKVIIDPKGWEAQGSTAPAEEASFSVVAGTIFSIAILLTYILGHGTIVKLTDYINDNYHMAVNPAVHQMLVSGTGTIMLTEELQSFYSSIMDPATTVKFIDSNGQGLPFEARMNRTTISAGDSSNIYLDRATGDIAYEDYSTHELRKLLAGTQEYDLYYNAMLWKLESLRTDNLNKNLLTVDQKKDLDSISSELIKYGPDYSMKESYEHHRLYVTYIYSMDPTSIQVRYLYLDRQTGSVVDKNSLGMVLQTIQPGEPGYNGKIKEMRESIENEYSVPPADKHLLNKIATELKKYQALGSVTITPKNQFPITVSMNLTTIKAGDISSITLDRATGILHYEVRETGENRPVDPTDPHYQMWLSYMPGFVNRALEANSQTQTLSADELVVLENIKAKLNKYVKEVPQAASAEKKETYVGFPGLAAATTFSLDATTIQVDNAYIDRKTGMLVYQGLSKLVLLPGESGYANRITGMRWIISNFHPSDPADQQLLDKINTELEQYQGLGTVTITPKNQFPITISMNLTTITTDDSRKITLDRQTGILRYWVMETGEIRTVEPSDTNYQMWFSYMPGFVNRALEANSQTQTLSADDVEILNNIKAELSKYVNDSTGDTVAHRHNPATAPGIMMLTGQLEANSGTGSSEEEVMVGAIKGAIASSLDQLFDPSMTVEVTHNNLPLEAKMNATTISVGDINKYYLDRERGYIIYQDSQTGASPRVWQRSPEWEIYYNEMISKIDSLRSDNQNKNLFNIEESKLASISTQLEKYASDYSGKETYTHLGGAYHLKFLHTVISLDSKSIEVGDNSLDRNTGEIKITGLRSKIVNPGDPEYISTVRDMLDKIYHVKQSDSPSPANKYFLDKTEQELKHYQALGSVTVAPKGQIPITVSMNVTTITAGDLSKITLDRKTGVLHYEVYWTGENRVVYPSDPDYQMWVREIMGFADNALEANYKNPTLSSDQVFFLAYVKSEAEVIGKIPFKIENPTNGMPIIYAQAEARAAAANSLQEDKGIPVIGDIVSFFWSIVDPTTLVKATGSNGLPIEIKLDSKTIRASSGSTTITLNREDGYISSIGDGTDQTLRLISPADPGYKDFLGGMHGFIAQAKAAGDEKQQRSLSLIENELKNFDSGFAYVIVPVSSGLEYYRITMDSSEIFAAGRTFDRSTGQIRKQEIGGFPIMTYDVTTTLGHEAYERELGYMFGDIAKARNESATTPEQQKQLTLVENELRKYESAGFGKKDGGMEVDQLIAQINQRVSIRNMPVFIKQTRLEIVSLTGALENECILYSPIVKTKNMKWGETYAKDIVVTTKNVKSYRLNGNDFTTLVVTTENAEYEIRMPATASRKDGGEKADVDPVNSDPKGGIDFRSLPLNIQPAVSELFLQMRQIAVPEIVDLNAEWSSIEELSRISTPSCQRLKEYLAACYRKGELKDHSASVLSCVSKMVREDELESRDTDGDLKTMLAVLSL
ncbi:MAG: hypothetical protein NTY14_03180 [Candidatus Omnitrophica bacterium]|nr:hypothetical protein [Candidatus Omnitrophota bacterium]